MKEMWDKKAASYPRFTGAPSEFQTRLYAKIAEFGVKFDAKSLADIGCGTGVHTLLLADICREVTGMDISDEMLKIMLEDAAKFGVSNLTAVQSDFKNFNPNRVYDIAFSTMSPAISDEEDFEKFINLGKQRTIEEMTQNALWHLQISNFAQEEGAVRKRLESIAREGFVTEKIVSSMKLLVF